MTGPAGFSADASAAFEGINSTLLFSTVALVFVLLVLIYRSPIFWILPLFAVLLAESVVRGLGYLLASSGVVINGQVGGILLVLVFGAGTDYALLLTARYREELRLVEDKHEAMRIAVRQAGPAILASAGTVVAALLCLSLAQVNSTAGLGPVGAMGVAVAAVAMLTVLPALLLIGGRRAFWPFVPRFGSEDTAARGAWRRLGDWIERRHRPVWIVTALALGAIALGTLTLDDNLTTSNIFRGDGRVGAGPEARRRVVPGRRERADGRARHRSGEGRRGARGRSGVVRRRLGRRAGDGRAGDALRRRRSKADPVREAGLRRDRAAARAICARSRATPSSSAARRAEEADVRAATERDTKLLVPLVLLVVFAILVLLLRAVVAPVMLMATVVLSFFAAIGLSLLVFDALRELPGRGPELRALRVHLPRRARGRLQHLPHGTRPRGGASRADARRDADVARGHRRRDHLGRRRPRGDVRGARGAAARRAHPARGHGRARRAARHARSCARSSFPR